MEFLHTWLPIFCKICTFFGEIKFLIKIMGNYNCHENNFNYGLLIRFGIH